jgi:membrane associated rhomboid family serine protease
VENIMKIALWFILFVTSIALAMVAGYLVNQHDIVMAAGCVLGCIACIWYVERKMKQDALKATKFCRVMVSAFLVLAVGMIAITLISHINSTSAFVSDLFAAGIWEFRRYLFQTKIKQEKTDVKAVKEINFI